VVEARCLVVRGTVQGVGFRPFVARLADTHGLRGWVLNANRGVEIHVEGEPEAIDAFATAIRTDAPPAAKVVALDTLEATQTGVARFVIRQSEPRAIPTVPISPDLPVCEDCLAEMRDSAARRFEYPYINCTNCGPRFSVVTSLPYDRQRTTMAPWQLCPACRAAYLDPRDRRFHAEPVACGECGPEYRLIGVSEERSEHAAFSRTAALLRGGAIVAIKGIGGYHLCCDAENAAAVRLLRERKYRKSRPFAVMARDVAVARSLVHMDPATEDALTSNARPIVLAVARRSLPEVADNHRELGVMLPYAPIHHLLFGGGAPDVLVMTSGNRSSEPIAYEDEDARRRLDGIADAFLVGERPIARRVDDSVIRMSRSGRVVLRRARGYAPDVAARLPATRPILAVGADLKNTVTLVVDGGAIVSQHIGDLEHLSAAEAFRATVQDLVAMYALKWSDLVIAHDQHPQYASTTYALELRGHRHVTVQHHRAHIASVLAEREALDTPVVGIAFDGTGYGDDGSIWGGEFLVGSVQGGFSRAASLRSFLLPGGDAAAKSPVQAAAGALYGVVGLPDLIAPPFCFPRKFVYATHFAAKGVRTFACTSAGRLFDAAAALLGFIHDVEYEGQAAEWLEQLAWRASPSARPLAFRVTGVEIDAGPALAEMVARRLAGDEVAVVARAFHDGLALAIACVASQLCQRNGVNTVVLSGGTFQNALLLETVRACLPSALAMWTNANIPPNDGGISLGQAAIASVAQR
jgi:hydrogenase maturation protein HypF